MESVAQRAIALITKHGSMRSDRLAEELGVEPDEVSKSLFYHCSNGTLVSCKVDRPNGRAVNEYRVSAGGKAPAFKPLRGRSPVPPPRAEHQVVTHPRTAPIGKIMESGRLRELGAAAPAAVADPEAGPAPKARRAASGKRRGRKPGRPPKSTTKASGGGRRLAGKKTRKPTAAGVPAIALKSTGKVSRNTSAAPAPEGFRCGIFSDGSLTIDAAAGEITLSEPETRAMLHYLDRVLVKGKA